MSYLPTPSRKSKGYRYAGRCVLALLALLAAGAAHAQTQTTFTITAGPTTINETDANFTPDPYTITRTGPELTAAASVTWLILHRHFGAATEDEDFTALTGTVNFAAGDDSKNFTITVVGDNMSEPADEIFLIRLQVPDGFNSGSDYGPIAIDDDDDEIIFALNAPASPVVEGSAPAYTITYTTSDDSALASAVTVNVLVTNDVPTNAVFGSPTFEERAIDLDWDESETLTVSQRRSSRQVTVRRTVTIPAGTAAGTATSLNLPAVTDDKISERREHFVVSVSLSGAPDRSVISPRSRFLRGTIAASDPIGISVQSEPLTYPEGGPRGSFRVTFNIPDGVTWEPNTAGGAPPIRVVFFEGLSRQSVGPYTWSTVMSDGYVNIPGPPLSPDDEIEFHSLEITLRLADIDAFNFHAVVDGNDDIDITILDDDAQVWIMTATDPQGAIAADVAEGAAPILSPGTMGTDAESYFRLIGYKGQRSVRADTVITYCLAGTASGGTATDAERDYTWPSGYDPAATDAASDCVGRGTITLLENTRSRIYRLPIVLNDDGLNEGDETITATTVSATVANNYQVAVRDSVYNDAAMNTVATRTIKDNDTISLSIAAIGRDFDADTAGIQVGEGRSAMFTVTLSAPSTEDATVAFSVGGDVIPADYTATSPLTIPAGQTTGTIAIALTDDTDAAGEDLTVTLAASGHTAAGAIARHADADQHSATVEIIDRTAARTLTLTRYSNSNRISVTTGGIVIESSTGTDKGLYYTIGLKSGDFPFPQPTAVNWSVTYGTPPADAADLRATSGTVMMTDGADFVAFVVGDDRNENDEKFSVHLSVANPAADGGTETDDDSVDNVTIIDSDTVNAAITATAAVTEGGNAVLSVDLGVTATTAVTVAYAITAATATAADYSDTDGGDITINPGESGGDITIAITDDAVNEAAETFSVTITAGDISGNIGRTDIASGGEQTFTIAASDPIAAAISPPSPATVEEGQAVTFSVTLGGAAEGSAADVVVTYTAAGTTDTPTDANSGSITIPAGASSGDIVLSIPSNASLTAASADETLTVTLTAATPAAGGGSGSVAADPNQRAAVSVRYVTPAHIFSFTSPTTTIAEGAAASVYTISRSGPTIADAGGITVTAAVVVDTAAAADFMNAAVPTADLVFTANQTNKAFTVTTATDTLNEGDETFSIALSTTDATVESGIALPADLSLTITDDDADAIGVAITADNTSVVESGTANFTVTLSGGARTADVVVPFTVHGLDEGEFNITAPAGIATTAFGGSLLFSGSSSGLTGTVSVDLIGDGLNEADKTLRLSGGTATSAGAVAYTSGGAQAMVTVTDDDPITRLLIRTVPQSANEVNEGGTVVFSIEITGGPSAGIICVPLNISIFNQQPNTGPDIALVAPNNATCADRRTPISVTAGGSATASVEIPAGQISANFSIRTLLDNHNESTEMLTVIPGDAADDIVFRSGGGRAESSGVSFRNTATVNIQNVNAARALAVAATTAQTDEGGDLVFAITVNGADVTEAFDVTWTASVLSSDTANVPADDIASANVDGIVSASALTGTARFTATAGVQTRILTLRTMDDSVTEEPEFVVITLTDPCPSGSVCAVGGRAGLASNFPSLELTGATAQGSIGHNDRPVPLSITAPDAQLSEGAAMNFVVSHNAASVLPIIAPITATWTVTFPTASASVNPADAADFAIRSGTISIPADRKSVVVAITATDDMVNEAVENFSVALSNPAGGGSNVVPTLHSANATATAAIAANDDLVAHIALVTPASGGVSEGAGATFSVTLRTGTAATAPVGTSGGEICLPFSTLVTNQQTPANDATSGADIALVAPHNGTCAARTTAASVTAADGSATASVVIAAGKSTADFSINALFDSIDEGDTDETLQITLGTPLSRSGAGAATSSSTAATVPINNVGANRILSVSTTTANADEGEDLVFTVTLSGAAVTEAFNVNWNITAGGGEVDGGDSGMVSFSVGSLPQSRAITLAATDDTDSEAATTVTVTLTDPCGAGVCAVGGRDGLAANMPSLDLATTVASGTIGESDRPLTLAIIAPDAGLSEEAAANFVLRFPEGVTTTAPVTAAWAISFPMPSATVTPAAVADFAAINGMATIPAGQRSATIAIIATDDSLSEPAERFTITLSSPAGGGAVAVPTLHDDDFSVTADIAASDGHPTAGAHVFTFTSPAATITEGGAATYTVTRSGPDITAVAGITVTAAITADTATAADFTGRRSADLLFMAGETSKTFGVYTAADTLNEGDERFTLALTTANTAANGGIALPDAIGITITDDPADAIRVTITGPTSAITEGGTAHFSVALSGGARTADVVVPFTVSGLDESAFNITAPAGIDAAATVGSIAFSGGSSNLSGTVSVAVPGNQLNEEDKTLAVTGGTPTAAGSIRYTVGGERDTVTVRDDDTVMLSIFEGPAVKEGGTAEFTVFVSPLSAGTICVPLRTSVIGGPDIALVAPNNGTCADRKTAVRVPDNGIVTTSVEIPAGQYSARFSVRTLLDGLNEQTETLRVFFGEPVSPRSGAGIVTQPDTSVGRSVVIQNVNAVRALAITATTARTSEGGDLVFAITVRGADVTVPFNVAWTIPPPPDGAGEGIANAADFASANVDGVASASATSGSVHFIATSGTQTRVLTLRTMDDADFEINENLIIRLTNPCPSGGVCAVGGRAGLTSGVPSLELVSPSVNGTIEASDYEGFLSIAAPEPELTEGATMNFVLTLASSPTTAPVTADWAITFPAASASVNPANTADFAIRSGSVSIPAGQNRITLPITAAADRVNEAAETFAVRLSNIGGGGEAVARLDADDFTATATIAASNPLWVHLARAPGQSGAINEGGRAAFTITLRTGASATAAPAAASGNICVPFRVTVGNQQTTLPASPNNAASGADIALLAPHNATCAGTTVAPALLNSLATASVAIPAGDSRVDFSIMTRVDGINEGAAAERLSLSLPSAPVTPAGVGDITRAAAAAVSVDIANVNAGRALALDAATAAVDEGGDLVFHITLSGADATAPFTVVWAVAAGAMDDIASSANGSVNFAAVAGTQRRSVTISTLDDALEEMAETVTVILSNPCPASGVCGVGGRPSNLGVGAPSLELTSSTASGIIRASDHPLTLSLSAPDEDLTEGTAAEFTVSFPERVTTTAAVTATWTISLPGASTATAADFAALSGTATIPAGQSSVNVPITAVDETLSEAAEAFTVTLSNPAGGGAIAVPSLHQTNNAATATIAANDALVVRLTRSGSGSVNEGGIATFRVTLHTGATATGTSSGLICVPFTAVVTGQQTPANNAASGADIALVAPDNGTCAARNTAATVADSNGMAAASVHIPAGLSTATFQIMARLDDINEGTTDEMISVTVGAPVVSSTNGGISRDTAAATVPIRDLSFSGTLSIAAPTATAAEGGDLVFTVSVTDVTVTEAFTVAWRVTAGGDDVTPTSGMVNFGASETMQTITLAVTDDSADEMDETVTVTLTDPCPAPPVVCSVGGRPPGATANTSTLRLTTAAASGTIGESDHPLTLSLTAPGDDLTEGTAAMFAVSFPESVTTTEPVTATWTITFPASSPTVNPAAIADFTAAALSDSVTIPAGMAGANFSITADDEAVNEALERFTVTLSSPAGGGAIAAPTLHTTDHDADVAIAANDPAVAHLSRAAGGAVNEGGNATFTVTLRTADADTTSGGEICVPFTVRVTGQRTPANDADSGADIALVAPNTGTCTARNTAATVAAANGMATASVLITAGQSAASFSIGALFDGIDEGDTDELISVTLGTPVVGDGAGSVTSNAAAVTAPIANLNSARTLSVANADPADEGEELSFSVTVGGAAVSEAFAVNWSVNSDAGVTPTSGTVNFGAGESSQTISLSVTDDDDAENDETVTLTLTDPCIGSSVCAIGGRPPNLPANAPSLLLSDGEAMGVIRQSDQAVTLTIAAPSGELTEGTATNFTVRFTESVTTTAAVTVDWTLTYGTASAADFTVANRNGTATIAAGESSVDVAITAAADSLNESSETFTVTLSNADGGGAIAAPVVHSTDNAVDVTIAASDAITVSIAADAATVNEGAAAAFTVTLSVASAANITVPYTLSDIRVTPTDADGGDIVITAGSTDGTVTLGIPFDGTLGSGTADDKLTVTLGTITVASGGGMATAAASPNNSASVTVNYVDAAHTISFDSPTLTIVEGAPATYTVNRNGPDIAVGNNIMVRWTYTAVSVDNDDFTSVPAGGMLTFSGSETSKMFTVTTAQDTDSEADETFTLGLTATNTVLTSNGGVALPTSDITVTIGESDRPVTLEIDAPTADLSEGTAANFTVSFAESVTTTAAVTVDWTVTYGTATAADFTAANQSGTATIAAGQSSVDVPIIATADDLNEGDETFTVTLSNAAGGGEIAAPTLHTTDNADNATIAASDDISVSIAADATTVNEGNNAVFTVTLSGAANGSVADITVAYSLNTIGVTPTDANSGSITINAGQLSGTVTLGIPFSATLGNSDDDDTLTVTLGTITVASGGGTATAHAMDNSDSVTVNYLDVAHTIEFSSPVTAIVEGDTATYTVTRNGPAITGSNIVVRWTYTAGTADSNDFTTVPAGGMLTFSGSDTSRTFTVATRQDTASEDAETFMLGLTATSTVLASNGGVGLPSGGITVTIGESDRPVTLSIAAPAANLTEGAAANFTVRFAESITTTAAVTARWTITHDSTSAADFTAANRTGIATIAAGMNSVDVAITAAADNLNEAVEMFTVTLSNAAGGGAIAAPRLHQTNAADDATINASDPITVSIAADATTVNEGATAVFSVTLSGATNGSAANISVAYTLSNISVTPTDANGGSITINAGQLSGNIRLGIPFSQLLGSSTPDDMLTVSLGTITVASGGGAATTHATDNSDSVTVNYLDVLHTIEFSNPATTIAEGDSVTYTVTRNGPAISGGNIVVRWTYAAGTVDNNDFTSVPAGGTLTFSGSDTSRTFTVATRQDTESEPGETFTLGLTATNAVLRSNGGVGLPGDITVTIGESDRPVTLSIAAPASNLIEGTAANFTVRFTESVTTTEAVTATWTISFPGASTATAADFATLSGIATIAAGQSSASVAIIAAADSLNEGAETFTVTLSNAAGGGAIAAPTATDNATATVAASDPITAAITGPAAANEGESIAFTVNLGVASAADVTVTYRVTAAGDHAPPFTDTDGGDIVITAGELSGTITVRSDPTAAVDSGTGTLSVAITAVTVAPGGGSVGGSGSATVTVTFREFERFFAVTVDNATPGEGDGVTFTVALTGTVPTSAATVDWSIAGDDADYSGNDSGSLSFTALGERTIAITITDDDLIEGDNDTLTFTLSNASGGGGTGSGITTAAATVTIIDNDAINVTIRGPNNINEESVATYTVDLSARVLTPTNVALTTTGTATAADFSLSASSVTVDANERTTTFTVTTTDGGGDDTDNRTLILTATVAGVAPGTRSVTITEDDPAARATRVVTPLASVAQSVGQLASAAVGRRMALTRGNIVNVGGHSFAVVGDAEKESATGAWAANPFEREQMLNAHTGGGAGTSAKELLQNSSFALSLSGDDVNLWGSNERVSASDGGVGNVRYNSDVVAWHIGADMPWKDGLLGIAVAQSSGRTDFTADGVVSHLKSDITSVHPYLSRNWRGARVWSTFGYGMGEAQLREEATFTSDLSVLSLASGISISVNGHWLFSVDGQWSHAKLDGDNVNGKTLPRVSTDSLRMNAGVEAGMRLTDELRPFLTLNIRRDFGDGGNEGVADYGGGMEWNSRRFHARLEGSNRVQGRGADEKRVSLTMRRTSKSGVAPYARWDLDNSAVGARMERESFSLGMEVGVADNKMEFKNLLSGELRF